MEKVASFALGCKVNQYESQAIGELFQERGYDLVDVSDKADVYVINTCTVTNFGDKKSRQIIRKVKRQNKDAVVVVVGCYAQTAPEEIMNIEGVNLVVGTKDKSKIVQMVEQYSFENGVENYVSDIMTERAFEPLSIEKLENRTRAYLKIQDGCSQYCSYCIIPFARGPIRSRNPEDIIEEVIRLRNNGFLEIVLTGIHVASYGKDTGNTNLLDILTRVNEIDGIERIRFSSVEPNVISEEFVIAIKNMPKVCHHFHLSLQSGCDETLKNMNRKYNTSQFENSANILKKHLPDVGLTTDIIVGFPNESLENFNECVDFAKKIGFSKIHVFPYSPKRGTPAATMENQISSPIKAERSSIMSEVAENMTEDFYNKFINKELSVLVEREVEPNVFEGHSSNYIPVRFKSLNTLKNQIVNIKITQNSGDFLFGEKRL